MYERQLAQRWQGTTIIVMVGLLMAFQGMGRILAWSSTGDSSTQEDHLTEQQKQERTLMTPYILKRIDDLENEVDDLQTDNRQLITKIIEMERKNVSLEGQE